MFHDKHTASCVGLLFAKKGKNCEGRKIKFSFFNFLFCRVFAFIIRRHTSVGSFVCFAYNEDSFVSLAVIPECPAIPLLYFLNLCSSESCVFRCLGGLAGQNLAKNTLTHDVEGNQEAWIILILC